MGRPEWLWVPRVAPSARRAVADHYRHLDELGGAARPCQAQRDPFARPLPTTGMAGRPIGLEVGYVLQRDCPAYTVYPHDRAGDANEAALGCFAARQPDSPLVSFFTLFGCHYSGLARSCDVGRAPPGPRTRNWAFGVAPLCSACTRSSPSRFRSSSLRFCCFCPCLFSPRQTIMHPTVFRSNCGSLLARRLFLPLGQFQGRSSRKDEKRRKTMTGLIVIWRRIIRCVDVPAALGRCECAAFAAFGLFEWRRSYPSGGSTFISFYRGERLLRKRV